MSQCGTCLENVASFKFEFPSKHCDIRKKELKEFLFKYHFNNLNQHVPQWSHFATSQIGHFITQAEPNSMVQGLMKSKKFTTVPNEAVNTEFLFHDENHISVQNG